MSMGSAMREMPCWTHGFDIPADVLERWQTLWSQAERPTPNAHPERFLATTRALGSQPLIAETQQKDGRYGLVVARLEKMRICRRIGYLPMRTPLLRTLVVVHGGILGNVSPDATAKCLNDVLHLNKTCEHIMLNMVPTDSPVLECLRDLEGVVIQPPIPHWMRRLDNSFEAMMEELSRKHRYNLRKELRNLESVFNESCDWLTLTQEDEIERILAKASWISSQTYHAKLGGGFVKTNELWRVQLRLAAASSCLRAHFLIGNGTPVAFWLGWNELDTLHLVTTGYLPEYAQYSPGKHLLLYAFKRACEDGMKRVDFGFGDAEYKRIYGTQSWQESEVHIYGSSLKAALAYNIDIATTRIDSAIRRAISSRTAAQIKQRWRRWITPRKK